ncbi:MAG: hypothetical protein MJZ50_09230 [Treponema sp.]|nr:hypothetical protein [Treponema sp.]
MKLVGLLKDKVEKAETMEEKKDLIKEAGVELNDDELEGVAGGRFIPTPDLGKFTL